MMRERKTGTLWMMIGGLLMSAALFLSIYNLYDAKMAEKSVKQVSVQMHSAVEENIQQEFEEEIHIPDYERYPEMEMPIVEIDGEYYIGFLEIPQLNLSLPIMGGEWSERKLKKAPCLYEGSLYLDNMVIAGHNYRSHFSGLKKLKEGTEIHFIDAEGNVFSYTLAWMEVIDEYDIHKMLSKDEAWDLTLFTCTYGGKDRYTLRCIRNI